MATELLTRGLATTDRASPLTTLKSSQVATVRHDEISFGDMVDMVNPLHHIPVVSSLYSDTTGDVISPVAKLVGGGLLGGVFGLIGAAVNVIFEEATGDNLITNVANAVLGNENTTTAASALKKQSDDSRFYHVTPASISANVEANPVDIQI